MPGPRTTRQLRRDALGQDALLFCAAFTAGAVAYVLAWVVHRAATGGAEGDFWSVSLSDDLIVSGLAAGEAFLVWNNGLRQGRRGHSIGKHRVGLAVVDVADDAPTGTARGLLRGIVTALLLDLSAAAIPIGLPTVLRQATPDAWHVGGASYLALLVLVVPLVVATDRGLADRVARTRVVRARGADALTTPARRRLLTWIDAAGVAGLLAVAITYIAFYSPLLRFPDLL